VRTDNSTLAAPPLSFIDRLGTFARDIKLSHSVFALPFALLATVLAAHRTAGGLRLGHVVLVVLCMVLARTVAMAANRLLDAKIDAMNPRTARRAIPSGALSARFVSATLFASAAGFVLATAGFWWLYGNPWPVALAVPVLLYLAGYPYMKRFTRLCHYYLGLALALAPVCAWLAVKGSIDAPPLWMAAAVLAWTAGFDILYACQDYAVDVAQGLHSVPSKFGIATALLIARLTHAVAAAMFVGLAMSTPEFGVIFSVGVSIAIALLAVEHTLVRGGDLSKLNVAFFTVNGIISVLVGVLGIVDVMM
jgi:4-hydroxybenzoate polyprenyltransferase